MKSKDDLEVQKLALEIRELQRAWWQRPAYLSILIPIVLGSLTVLAGILSGYFDRERTHLKREVEALKREKSALLETQNAIRQANADAEERLNKFNETYKLRVSRLRSALSPLKSSSITDPEIRHALEEFADNLMALLQIEPSGSPTPTPEQKK